MNAVVSIRQSSVSRQSPECAAPRAGRRASARIQVPGVVPASRLEVRPAPALAPTGVAAVDALTGGLPRGALTEVFGPASSGRTSLLVSALAQTTARGEVCALVDVSNSFAPGAAEAAGVDLRRLLWVRCGNKPQRRRDAEKNVSRFAFQVSPQCETRTVKRETWVRLEQALKATDLLLQSGGFGLVAVDLGNIPAAAARRVSLTSWFRFRRAVENTATVLLVLGRESCAETCASLVVQLSAISRPPSARLRAPGAGRRAEPPALSIQPSAASVSGNPSHAELLTGMAVRAEVIRSRRERKPVRDATAEFETRAEWA